MSVFRAASRTASLAPSVWNEFTPLAIAHNAVNLGQGFPDYTGPKWILDETMEAVREGVVQYTRSVGHAPLTQQLAHFYSRSMDRDIDAQREVHTTVGATQALYLSVSALVDPGDECIMIEPFYDSYPGCVALAGGVPKYLALQRGYGSDANNWLIPDEADFERVVSPKSKLLFLNTPQNVPGKVWTLEELERIARIATDNDLIVIADEVYEALLYDSCRHVHLASLPGMFERTLTISSIGKTFSITGYKVGWIIAPEEAISAINQVHVQNVFCHGTPLQEGAARLFRRFNEQPQLLQDFYADFQATMTRKRDRLAQGLSSAGLDPIIPQGSFFMLADTSAVDEALLAGDEYADGTSNPDTNGKDYRFCRWLTKEVGVCAIPPSAFFAQPNSKEMARNYARFAFCKTDKVLEQGIERLQGLHQFLHS